MDNYQRLLDFLTRLDRAKIHFELRRVRDEAIMVEVCVPGERWEIEFMDDGSVEVERFRSRGEIQDETALEELFQPVQPGNDSKEGPEVPGEFSA